MAEAIVAEDDGAVLDPRVGDDELATWGGKGEGFTETASPTSN